MKNSNDTRQSAASAAKTWRALTVFSALSVLVFAVLLYKAVAAKFNPPPRTQARAEETQNPFQNIASSGAIAAVSIETPAAPPPFAQQEAPVSTATVPTAIPQEETLAEPEPTATHTPDVEEQPKEQNPPLHATEQPAKPKARKVRFVYNSNANDSVKLSGTFISWKTAEMKRVKGKWVAELYMGPGTYRYCFIVNGIKTPDPLQPLRQGGHSLAVVR